MHASRPTKNSSNERLLQMRIGFLQSAMGEIVSALVPASSMPSVLLEGEQLTFLADFCLPELGVVIAAGVTAYVIMHCAASGAVELSFDAPVPGLHTWGNTLLLVPFHTEDALEALNTALQLKPNCVVSLMNDPVGTVTEAA